MTIDQTAALAQRLGLVRPLVILDVETTPPYEGARPRAEQDRIVQFAAMKLFPDGATREFSVLVQPGIPVAASSRAIHGITTEMLTEARTWAEVGPGIIRALHGCDLGGYHVKGYDLPVLRAECERHRIYGPEPDAAFRIVDCYAIAATRERRDLAWALSFYAGRQHEQAHKADGDVSAVVDVLAGQFAMYADLPADVAALHDFAFPVDPTWLDPDGKLQWADGQVVITFGDLAGTPVDRLDAGMVRWIMKKNFSEEVKETIRKIREGCYPSGPMGGAAK